MSLLLVIIHVIVCFLLIAVILLQAGRGQGLTGSAFTGGGVQSLFGTRASSFLMKATSVSAVFFLFTCIGLDLLEARRSRSVFQTQRAAVPVDVQQIQKILEKIKSEEKGKVNKGTAALTEETKPVTQVPSAPPVAQANEAKNNG